MKNDIAEKYKKYIKNGQIEFITFHPSYSYEEFIEGITVHTEAENKPTDSIQYIQKSGKFKTLCTRALNAAINSDWEVKNTKTWREVYEEYSEKEDEIEWKEAPKFVLIIDEINRGDISKIFGELITLIEADKRLHAPNEITAILRTSGDVFGVPPNVYVIGTMNTADRSIALIDIALRRRFGFIEMKPDLDLPLSPEALSDLDEGTINRLRKSKEALEKINARISNDRTLGLEKQIGHAYLFQIRNEGDVDQMWQHDIVPLLQEYCYNNSDRMNQILFGDSPSDVDITDTDKLIEAIINAK